MIYFRTDDPTTPELERWRQVCIYQKSSNIYLIAKPAFVCFRYLQFQHVTVVIGDPVDLNDQLQKLQAMKASPVRNFFDIWIWIAITWLLIAKDMSFWISDNYKV